MGQSPQIGPIRTFAIVTKPVDELAGKSRTLASSVTIAKSLTRVTVGPSEAKVAHTDAVCPQRFTVSLIITVWTRIVFKLAA